METIEINTGLEGFILPEKVLFCSETKIQGETCFENGPVFLGMEAMAQLGALHVRYLNRFECHSFLLKVTSCSQPDREQLEGKLLLSGELVHHSRKAYSYKLEASQQGETLFSGEFLFATVDYDPSFQEEILKQHYQNVFSCLLNESNPD